MHFVIVILKLVLLLLLLAITHERPLCVQNIGYISVIYVKYFKFVNQGDLMGKENELRITMK